MPWPGVTEDSMVCTDCGRLDSAAYDGDPCLTCDDGRMKMAAEILPTEDFDEDGNYIGEP